MRAVPAEVGGQVMWRLGLPRADDEPQAGLVQGLEVRRREHTGVSHHDHVGDLVTLGERLDDGHDGVDLGLVALIGVQLQGKPRSVNEDADDDLRIHRRSLE
ncbi:MAG TPA: hypothetical protein VK053_11855 [Jiangellaceae bacterium]|nr:hypothetical protein [Jiangellaceae bacterium]